MQPAKTPCGLAGLRCARLRERIRAGRAGRAGRRPRSREPARERAREQGSRRHSPTLSAGAAAGTRAFRSVPSLGTPGSAPALRRLRRPAGTAARPPWRRRGTCHRRPARRAGRRPLLQEAARLARAQTVAPAGAPPPRRAQPRGICACAVLRACSPSDWERAARRVRSRPLLQAHRCRPPTRPRLRSGRARGVSGRGRAAGFPREEGRDSRTAKNPLVHMFF